MPKRQFVDDPTIADEARLFRMVHLNQVVLGQHGEALISSGAFRDHEMSVTLEPVLIEQRRKPEDCLASHPRHKLVAVRALACRQNSQAVAPDPIPEEPAHGVVFGKKTNRIAHSLRDAAEWVVPGRTPHFTEITAELANKRA